ncbi:MAG TPA: hypothetical protein VG820_09365, partial [Fimbriimonadaceae bacterium]|nr:hypothetical protein [Fimbriimonadaceae bacterium]
WLVEGDSASRPDDLFAAISAALGIPAESAPVAQAVTSFLRDRQLLLILDSLEGLAAAGHGGAVSDLVANSGVKCLATSRRSLEADGEVALKIEPLTVDAAETLFLQAAGLRLQGGDVAGRGQVGDICACLEGVPLALRVAASRLHVVSLAELARLLRENSLRVLDGAEGRVSKAMERSLRLLSASERLFLWELSVFEGSLTWEDVAAVYAYDRFDLLDRLGRLVEHSLVQSAMTDGRRRFKLLDVVREYVLATADDGSRDWDRLEARRRHADHFSSRAQRIAQLLKAGDWGTGYSMIWADLANFRSALHFWVDAQQHAQTVELVDTLSRSLMEAGLWSDFEDFATKGYAAAEQTGDVAMRSRLLGLHGAMAARQGDEAECRRMWRKRVELCDEIGDQAGAADALIDLAIQSYQDRSLQKCLDLVDQADARNRGAVPLELLATAKTVRGMVAFLQDDRGLALGWAREAMDQAKRASPCDSLLFVWTNAARVMRDCGVANEAVDALAQAIRYAMASNRRVHLAVALTHLSAILEELGQIEVAGLGLSAARAIYLHIQSKRLAAAEARLREFLARNSGHTSVAAFRPTNDLPSPSVIEVILSRLH